MLHMSGYCCPECIFGTFHKVTASTAVNILNAYFTPAEDDSTVTGENQLLP